MIVENKSVKSDLMTLDKKHIFVIILALKQLCVHPMLLLKSAYKDMMDESDPVSDVDSEAN